MNFTVRMAGKIIVGHSALERLEAAGGVVRGAFRPGMGYELVQDIFRLHDEATAAGPDAAPDEAKLERYRKARDALKLQLVDARGREVPNAGMHIIARPPSAAGAPLVLEVQLTDVVRFALRYSRT